MNYDETKEGIDKQKKQAAANAEAQRRLDAERQRAQAIRDAAKNIRLKTAILHRENKAIRDEIAEFAKTCGADLLELRAVNETLTIEQTELRKKLALLKTTAGVA